MLRLIEFSLFQHGFSLVTVDLIHGLSLVMIYFFLRNFCRFLSRFQLLVFTLLPSWAALPGGKLAYSLMVDRSLGLNSDGQGYFGALLAQSACTYLLTWFLFRGYSENTETLARLRAQIMDTFAVLSAFVYGVLRLGCFASGCCYGKLCRYPWAVVFKNENALTPFLGLPLHPSQLYAMSHGVFAGLILLFLHKKRSKLGLEGWLYWIFLILMGSGRLLTEQFRGDLKPTLWNGWYANQWLSVAILLIGGLALCYRSFRAGIYTATLVSKAEAR